MNHYIKNFDTLAKTSARRDALTIVEAGYQAIDTDAALRAFVQLLGDTLSVGERAYKLTEYEHIYIVGCGKVACRAAATLEDILKGKVSGGAVIGVTDMVCQVVTLYKGTHPKPSEKNFAAAQHMLQIGEKITERDLVLAIVGGGGSSLLCASTGECDQGVRLYEKFLDSGGIIDELNLVRKHISPLKGGGLAKALYPATVVGLVFSDVPGGDPSAVASGPTYFDASTIADAEQIIQKYNLGHYVLTETPKEQKYFENVWNVEVVSNKTAVAAMSTKAHELGYTPIESACAPGAFRRRRRRGARR
jgi:hydroxypyruvate reductase